MCVSEVRVLEGVGGVPLLLPNTCGQVFRREGLKSYPHCRLSRVLERQAGSTRISEAPLVAPEVAGLGGRETGPKPPTPDRGLGAGEGALSAKCVFPVLRLSLGGVGLGCR